MVFARATAVLSLAFALVASPFSSALAGQISTVEQDFDSLKEMPVDYVVFGVICEQVARLRLKTEYPASSYQIDVGVEYKVGTRTIGELDVVVVRKSDGKAVLVSEVKCRRSMGSAARHAREQLQRFRSTLASSGNGIRFVPKELGAATARAAQFDGATKYIAFAQDGGTDHGFDRSIGLGLDEVTDLRTMLMACQAAGDCPVAGVVHH